MADQLFPGTSLFSDQDSSIRRRHVAEREPPSPRSTPVGVNASPRGARHSITEGKLQDFFTPDQDHNENSDTELPEISLRERQDSEPDSEPPLTRSGRSAISSFLHHAHRSFVSGDPEPSRVLDPEEAPTPEDGPGRPRRYAAGLPSQVNKKPRRRSASVSTEDLVQNVRRHFPPRAPLSIQIIDFYEDRAKRSLVPLHQIATVSNPSNKPEGVVVRWIHAPLGVGLFHSSVEDIFLKGQGQRVNGHWRRPSIMPRGMRFTKAGRAGWPYLETEILTLRSTKEMQDARETAHAFLEDEEAQAILNEEVFSGDHLGILRNDVRWRSYHIGKGIDPDYWETVKSDLPLLLSDGALIMKSPAATKQQPNLKMKPQTLQEDPAYQYAYLARDSFRCFNRGDGFLLSLSPSTGIDYLNRHLPEITKDPDGHANCWRPEERKQEESPDNLKYPNVSLSVIAHIFAAFEDSGTKNWQHKNAEWLMVFLMTEISCTPHSMRSGYSIATVLDAYDTQVSKLIERKFEPWAHEKTAKLFQSYLTTIDELRTLDKIYKKKLTFLKRLDEDCTNIQIDLGQEHATTQIDSPIITMAERVHFARRAVQDLSDQCEELYTDLTSSLESMSQLRFIEQNDRSISADSQSEGILILSAVTIVFLPLSFLASLFSMNVQGISGSPPPMTLGHFCTICGVVTVGLVFFISIFLWRVKAGNNLMAVATILRRHK